MYVCTDHCRSAMRVGCLTWMSDVLLFEGVGERE